MVHPDNILEMERTLSERGISVAELCRQAEIAETTWGRWKRREVSPNFKTWDNVARTFGRLTADAGVSQ